MYISRFILRFRTARTWFNGLIGPVVDRVIYTPAVLIELVPILEFIEQTSMRSARLKHHRDSILEVVIILLVPPAQYEIGDP